MTTEDKKIAALHTPCKNCIAAIYENKTQTGCYFDQLKNFDSILEVYDNEHEFYVVNNKKCMYYRENNWLEKRGIGIEQAQETIVKENTIKYIAIINLDQIKNKNNLEKAVSELKKQKEKPCGIVVMMQKKVEYDISIKEVIDIMQGSGFIWKIKNFIEAYDLYRYVKAIIQTAPRKRLYLLVNNSNIPNNFYSRILDFNMKNNPISAINLNENIFFSFAAVAYTIQLFDKNILEDKDLQKKYEDI